MSDNFLDKSDMARPRVLGEIDIKRSTRIERVTTLVLKEPVNLGPGRYEARVHNKRIVFTQIFSEKKP